MNGDNVLRVIMTLTKAGEEINITMEIQNKDLGAMLMDLCKEWTVLIHNITVEHAQ